MRTRIKELEDTQGSQLAMVSLSSCDADMQQGRQLDFMATTLNGEGDQTTHCCTDTGASAKSFINTSFTKHHKLSTMKLVKPVKLRLANGKVAGIITHAARAILAFGDHIEELYCLVTPLSKFDIILGMPWMELHDPHISFKQRTCRFHSDHCLTECLKYRRPVTITSPGTPHCEPKPSDQYGDIAEISAYAFTSIAERHENQVVLL